MTQFVVATPPKIAPGAAALASDSGETPLRLMWRKLRRHRLAQISGVILILLYAIALFADFLAPRDPNAYVGRFTYAPPQQLHLFDTSAGLAFAPFVYDYKVTVDPVALKRTFTIDTNKKIPVHFFVASEPYRPTSSPA